MTTVICFHISRSGFGHVPSCCIIEFTLHDFISFGIGLMIIHIGFVQLHLSVCQVMEIKHSKSLH